MKVRRVDINPHVRTVVFCLYRLISGLSREATLRTVAYVLPLAHTRVLGSFVSLSIGGGGFIETALPFFGGHGVTALPMWQPARRLTTAGMSKSDVRRVFAERGKAYQNTAVAASRKLMKSRYYLT